MKNIRKQNFLKGSVILIASVIITKIISALFKIPVTNMLGGTGMGYFSSAYGLFMPVYAFFVTGMSTAIAEKTAEYSALGMYKSIKKFRKLVLLCFGITGIIGSIIIILTAKYFSYYAIENENAYLSVLATAPSIFFGCIMAVYRGYYEGLRNMYPTAVSQIAESIVKLGAGLFLCTYILENPDKIPEYFKDCDIYALASAGAVTGIALSTLAGTLFLIVYNIFAGDGITRENIKNDSSEFSSKNALKELFSILIPIALGSLVTNLTSMIDLATIIRCLNNSAEKYPEYFSQRFDFFSEIEKDGFSNFAYGSFIGLAVTVFNLVPSVTNMFGKGVLPSVAESWTANDKISLKKHMEDAIKATAFIAVPSGMGICVLAKPVLELLFSSRNNEIEIVSESLSYLGLGVIFLALSFPLFSIFQGTGKAVMPLKIMIVGVAIKFIANIILIPIPQINISGAGISTDLCYLAILILSVIFIQKHTGIKLNLIKILFPSAYGGLLCAVTAVLVYDITEMTILAILCGGIIYLISVYLSDSKFFNKKITKKSI